MLTATKLPQGDDMEKKAQVARRRIAPEKAQLNQCQGGKAILAEPVNLLAAQSASVGAIRESPLRWWRRTGATVPNEYFTLALLSS